MGRYERNRSIPLALTIFTLIFLICGFAILAFGIYAYITIGNYSSLSHINFGRVSSLFIAIGAFVIIVAFVGCCGAWKLSRRLLIAFLAFMLIILLCQLTAMILGFMYKDEVQKSLQKDMMYALTHEYGQPGFEDSVTMGFDYLQKEQECCGIKEYQDWFKNKKTSSVPDSCCQYRPNCGQGHVDYKNLWNQGRDGCWKKLNELVAAYLPAIGGLAAGVLLIQLFSIGFAVLLFHQLHEDKTDQGGKRDIRPPAYPAAYKMEPQPKPLKKPPPPSSDDEYDPGKTYL